MKRLEAYDDEWFTDSYYVMMVLRKENGEIYSEEYKEISLTDFEVIYGNISDEMIECHLVLQKVMDLTDVE